MRPKISMPLKLKKQTKEKVFGINTQQEKLETSTSNWCGWMDRSLGCEDKV